MSSSSDLEADFSNVRRNRILIIGPSEPVLIHFLTKLLQAANQSDLVVASLSSTPSLADGLTIPFILDTRYYTAETSLWISCINENNQDINQWNVIAPAVDALIYVFDKSEPVSFYQIKPWSTFISDHEPNIALCIAHSASESTDTSGLEDCEEWCIDNGFELIDIEETGGNDVTDDSLEASREKCGLDRIVEALESNMWDGLVRKAVNSNTNTSSMAQPATSSESTKNSKATANTSDVASLYTAIFSSFNRDLSDGDVENNFEGFEIALQQLKTFREQSRGLPDDDRRELAARVALAFDEQFGGDDDDRNDPGDDFCDFVISSLPSSQSRTGPAR